MQLILMSRTVEIVSKEYSRSWQNKLEALET